MGCNCGKSNQNFKNLVQGQSKPTPSIQPNQTPPLTRRERRRLRAERIARRNERMAQRNEAIARNK